MHLPHDGSEWSMSLSALDLEARRWCDLAQKAHAKAETLSEAAERETLEKVSQLFEAVAEDVDKMMAAKLSVGLPASLAHF